MLDRTNVGISPLMSTPMTTSYVSSVPVATTTYQTVPQTTTFTQEAYPTTSYGTQIVNQGLTIPQTTTYTTQDPLTSFVPEITTPDQALTSIVPDATNIVSAPVQESVVPQVSMATSVVPNVIYNQQSAQPPAAPIAPIMDEDFQRGRPIHDEFNEDRYRNFKFGGQ